MRTGTGSKTIEKGTRPPINAAQYVRMSTDHQKYSTENQAEIIARYADQRGFTLVRTYEDSGKSGLRIDGRDALKRLLIEINRVLRTLHPEVVAQTVAGIERLGGAVCKDPTTDLLTVNDEFTASLVISRSFHTPGPLCQDS